MEGNNITDLFSITEEEFALDSPTSNGKENPTNNRLLGLANSSTDNEALSNDPSHLLFSITHYKAQKSYYNRIYNKLQQFLENTQQQLLDRERRTELSKHYKRTVKDIKGKYSNRTDSLSKQPENLKENLSPQEKAVLTMEKWKLQDEMNRELEDVLKQKKREEKELLTLLLPNPPGLDEKDENKNRNHSSNNRNNTNNKKEKDKNRNYQPEDSSSDSESESESESDSSSEGNQTTASKRREKRAIVLGTRHYFDVSETILRNTKYIDVELSEYLKLIIRR